MRAIDARTRALMDERSRLVGPDALPPTRELSDRSRVQPGDRARAPATNNPGADELGFRQAAADRDVAASLRTFSDAEMVLGPEAQRMDLRGAWLQVTRTGREYLSAEEEYILAAISLLIERHRWTPRLSNDTSVDVSADGEDFHYPTTLSVVNTLRATRRLPFGGEAEARWVARAAQQLSTVATDGYVQSSEIVLSANVPLLRGFGRDIAQESLVQSERDLVYAARNFEQSRRQVLVDIARDYFDILQTQAQIVNRELQLKSQERFLESTKEKVEAGRLRGFQQRLVENQVLQAQSSLASLREQSILQMERFKIRLGLAPSDEVEVLPFDLPLPEHATNPDQASEAAMAYRLDLQNRRDQLADARRAVEIARDQLRADLNLDVSGTLGTDNDRDVGGLRFDPGDADYSAGLTLSLPLDRRIERLQLRQSLIQAEQAQRSYEEFRDNVLVDARRSVRSVELSRFQLRLAEEQVTITESRLEEQQINEDTVDPQQRIDTELELLNARNARDQAVTDLRNAVLDYLLQTGQLRVAPDGSIKPLPVLE
ncbi:MAG: TolC family protein [Phycisphaerales bacterium]|nr:TolC family protein [Phycisphaerales bacterium]